MAGTWSVSFNPKGDKVTGNVFPAISLSVDKANIVYDMLSVSILGSGAFNGNVKNFKYKANGTDGANTEKDLVGELTMAGKAGLSFTYDSKFTAGFGINGDVDAEKNETFVRFGVAEMAISESVKVKGATALKAVDDKVDLRGTIKGSYTADHVTVVVASDLQCAEDKKITDEESAMLIRKMKEISAFLKFEQIVEWIFAGIVIAVIAFGLLTLI